MRAKFNEHDLDIAFEEEPNGVFDSLLDAFEFCTECDYEGPLTLRSGGYECPQCQTLVLPNG